MFIRKFYEADAGIVTGGGEVAEIQAPVEQPDKSVETKTPSLAEYMAKGGTKIADPLNRVTPTTKSTEKVEKPVETEKVEKSVETTTSQSSNVENGELKSPQKATEAKVDDVKPQIAETSKPIPTWQEILNQQPKNEVLKTLGYDDKVQKLANELNGFENIEFFSNLVNEWRNGDLKSYLQALNTDYSKMSSEEVMRHQLREEYPKASAEALEALFRKKIIQGYNLDSADEGELAEGRLLLDAEAQKYRDDLTNKQQTKLFPKVPQAKQSDAELQEQAQEAERQKEIEAIKSKIESDPHFTGMYKDRKITIGKGDQVFNYDINPDEVRNIIYDPQEWLKTQFEFTQVNGKTVMIPKVENQILTAAFAQNPQKFLQDYATSLLRKGGEKVIQEFENAKTKDKENPPINKPASDMSLAAQMAKHGVISK